MQAYHTIFNSDRYVRVSPLYNIVTIFDSTFYSRNDYEVLSPPQRNYIGQKLESEGHTRVTGNSYKNAHTGQFLKFITTKTLGVSPLYELQDNYNHDDIFIVTPGTYFLFLLMKHHKYQSQDLVEEMLQFLTIHPVNLQQLLDLSRHDDFYDFFKSKFPEFKSVQDKAVSEELKDKRPLGKIF